MRDDDDWEQSMDPAFDMETELRDLWGVTDRKAAQLSAEYPNLPTLSWATWHDQDYLMEEVQIDADFLRDQLYAADLYESYHHFPERVIRPDRPETAPQPDDPSYDTPTQHRLSDYTEE